MYEYIVVSMKQWCVNGPFIGKIRNPTYPKQQNFIFLALLYIFTFLMLKCPPKTAGCD